MTAPTEYALWQQFRSGDEQAFAVIYESFFGILYQYGFHIARNEELVKDCIQTVFVELWKSRATLSNTTSIKFYLLKVMRRKVYTALNREKRYDELSIDPEGVDVSFSPEFDLIARQTNDQQQQALKRAIDQLSPRQREAITLLYIEGFSYSEVAAIMMLKVRTVYNLIHIALESLRSQLIRSGLWVVLALLLIR